MTGLAGDLRRESGLFIRQRAGWLALAGALLLTLLALLNGSAIVREQHATIERLLAADAADRAAAVANASDVGGAAYASFHLTFDAPSPLAFAALGQRDVFPWLHRIRALALEGQIHEADTPNPELALLGFLDFAFVVAVLLPLLLILLLHDLFAAERRAGRHDLLVATAGKATRLWVPRALVRVGMLLLCVLVPFWVAAFWQGVSAAGIAVVSLVVVGQALLWSVVSLGLALRPWEASTIGAVLLSVWVATAVLVPVLGKDVIERRIPVPDGADILLTQRETVNGAWDLPKHVTMEAFVARHPEWADYAAVDRPFHWKWYYAFQQVGDQTAEPLVGAYRAGVLARDRATALLAWLSPSVAVDRALQTLAQTDTRSLLAYEDRVREFHFRLRTFFYPLLFRDEAFDPGLLDDMPLWNGSPGS